MIGFYMKLKEFYKDRSRYSKEEAVSEFNGKPCSPTYKYPLSRACLAAAIVNCYPNTFGTIWNMILEKTGMIPPRVNKLGYEIVEKTCDELDI